MALKLPARQIAYVVDDVVAAAHRHNETFGSGPFFIAEHIPFETSRYRREESFFDHSAAYGQWGNVMVEFMCQHDDHPSAVRDMFPKGSEGFHHIGIIVDSIADARAEMQRLGFDEAFYASLANGFEAIMFDARQAYGHFIEIYERGDGIEKLYGLIDGASREWDGEEVIRLLDLSQF